MTHGWILQSGFKALRRRDCNTGRTNSTLNATAEMLAPRTDIPTEKIRGLFCNETGYQTPKVDTRAAVFRDGKILLVRENNGTWSLPGGWCDVDQSIASNTEKEVLEETGLTVAAARLIAVQDWRKHNVTNYAWGVVKTFMLCRLVGEHRNHGGRLVRAGCAPRQPRGGKMHPRADPPVL